MSLRFVTVVLVVLAFASPVLAQVSEVDMPPSEVAARGHYLMGQEHYQAARFAEAADEFQRAYDLSQRPALLFNLYVAHRDAGQTREAARALRLYVDSAPADPQIEVLRGRLATLESQIAAEDARAAAASQAATEPTREPDATAPGEAAAPSSSGGDVGPWVVIGVGGAVAIGAIATAIVTSVTYGDLSSTCMDGLCPPGTDVEGRRSTGSTLALTSDLLGGVAAATMIGGIVWAIVDATSAPSTSETALRCTPLGCLGRF